MADELTPLITFKLFCHLNSSIFNDYKEENIIRVLCPSAISDQLNARMADCPGWQYSVLPLIYPSLFFLLHPRTFAISAPDGIFLQMTNVFPYIYSPHNSRKYCTAPLFSTMFWIFIIFFIANSMTDGICPYFTFRLWHSISSSP